MSTPTPAPPVVSGKPTRKVTIGSIGGYLVGAIALLIVNLVQGGQLDILAASLPGWANAILTPLIPALGAFAAGYITKHGPNDVLLPVLGRLTRRSTL